MNKVKIMVTGVGGGGHGEQILKCLKMSENNYEIIVGDMNPYSKGLYEGEFAYILPPANSNEYISKLLKICEEHQIQVLFHGSEPELKVLSESRYVFEEKGIFLPINPKEVIDICFDKYKTMNWLEQNQFDVPKYVKVTSEDDINKIKFLPAVIKPSKGGSGSANIYLAQTKEELLGFCNHLLKIYDEFLVQEYVGKVDSEYTVGVLISMEGELINSIAVKKMIMSGLSNKLKVKNNSKNVSFGEMLAISSGISQGEIGAFPEVTKVCEEMALKLGCRGAVNIQCRYMDGKVYVFEINPRFSGTSSLRALVGYNEPDILIKNTVLGEKINKKFTYEHGYILRGLSETFVRKDHILNLKGE